MNILESDSFSGLSEEQGVLLGSLIGLAKACENNKYFDSTIAIIIDSLRLLSANDENNLLQTDAVHDEKNLVVPNCQYCASPCGNTSDYNIKEILSSPLRIQKFKSQIIDSLYKVAESTDMNNMPAKDSDAAIIILKALAYLSYDLESEALQELIIDMEKFY